MVISQKTTKKRVYNVSKSIRAKGRVVRNAEIVALRRNGMALEDIGLRYGITKERVRQIISAYNESAPTVQQVPHMIIQRGIPVMEQRKSEILPLLLDGKSLDEITSELGISRVLLLRAVALLRNEGNYFPDLEKKSKIDLRLAQRMRAAGATLKTIAARFGATVPSVHELLDKHSDSSRRKD